MNRRRLPPAPPRHFDDGQFDGDRSRSFGFQGSRVGVPGASNLLGQSMPPWHLWGGSEVVTFSEGNAQTRQLAKVAYKRPETWHFFLYARPTSLPGFSPGDDVRVTVDFDLTIGVGRNTVLMNNVERFVWHITSGASSGLPKYATSLLGPVRNELTPVVADLNYITELTASDIQIQAQMSLIAVGGPNPASATVEVAAFFAPKSHVRPDWFRDGPEATQYLGGEVEGK